jgi:hypothetical protein
VGTATASGFELGIATVKVLQETLSAEVLEYDILPGGEVEVAMTIPVGGHWRRFVLNQARLLRNQFVLSRSNRVLAASRDHSSAVRAYLAARGAVSDQV